MKKIISLVLVAVMALSLVALAGCGDKKEESGGDKALKLGMGVYSTLNKAISAEGETQGTGAATVTVAGVLMDGDKIVKCVIDVADNTVNFTSDGKAVKPAEFKTKYEQGDSYGMKAYGGAKKEWYEQADAFVSMVEGKTYEEVKALVGAENKGNDDVISAGCTIKISDFIFAIENAVKNVKDSKAVKDNTLKIGMISTATTKDASEEAKGSVGFDVSIAVVASDKDGKVTAADSDVVSASFEFDTKGETSKDTAKVTSKKEAGANYGMASYGQDLNGDGTVKEWFEQADILDEKIIGKKADEITALAADTGYGVDDVQKAGCTINIGDMVKAAVKACK